MDILDSFGDWLQLFGAIAFCWVGVTFISGIARAAIPLPLTFVCFYLYWIGVYDYDIILGLLAGGIFFFFYQMKDWAEFNSHDSKRYPNNYIGKHSAMHDQLAGNRLWYAFHNLGIAVIMIIKITLFW